jgi:hypothetical protein
MKPTQLDRIDDPREGLSVRDRPGEFVTVQAE